MSTKSLLGGSEIMNFQVKTGSDLKRVRGLLRMTQKALGLKLGKPGPNISRAEAAGDVQLDRDVQLAMQGLLLERVSETAERELASLNLSDEDIEKLSPLLLSVLGKAMTPDNSELTEHHQEGADVFY